MKKSTLYVSVGLAVFSVVILTLYLSLKKPKSAQKPNDIIFIGGLDNRGGDLKLPDQVELLKKGLNDNFNIKPFRYFDGEKALKEIEKSKNPMFIVLFSAGAKYSDRIATMMKQKSFDLDNIYIVEPWGKGSNVNKLKNAAKIGVPAENFIVGGSSSTGKGVISGSTTTPNCKPGHWCAVTETAKIINQL